MDLSYFVFIFAILSCPCHAALWSPGRKWLTSWLSCMCGFLVFLSLSHTVSWVRCGTWLRLFLIFAFFLTITCQCFFSCIFRLSNLEGLEKVGLYINDLNMFDNSRDMVMAGWQYASQLECSIEQVGEH